MALSLLFAVVLSSNECLAGITHITHDLPEAEPCNLFDWSFQLRLEAGNYGENGASAQHRVAMDLDGGIVLALILEAAVIALVILWRLKFARLLIVKVRLAHTFSF